LVWTYNGGTNTSTSSYTALLDNTSDTVATSSTFNRTSTDLPSLGGRLTSGNVVSDGLVGDIGELLVTSNVISGTNETNMHTYFNNRYGSGVGLLEHMGESKYAANDNGEAWRMAN
jgi:hypothetical protein